MSKRSATSSSAAKLMSMLGKSKGADEWSSSNKVLGKIELTQQPEKVFYKDEGGIKWSYLFVFFVVRAARTDELKARMDKAEDGRRKIKVDCDLCQGPDRKIVEDASSLVLLGNSIPDGDVMEGEPEFDPQTFTGSVRYRINQGSKRFDNKGFRLRLSLRGLEDVIQPAYTEPTVVLSKRKTMRKAHRKPEIDARRNIEDKARARNFEVEKKLARCPPTSTPLIHDIGIGSGFTEVPDFPSLKRSTKDAYLHEEEEVEEDGRAPKRAKLGRSSASPSFLLKQQEEIDRLKDRVAKLEEHFSMFEAVVLKSVPSYAPDDAGRKGKMGTPKPPAPAPPPPPARKGGAIGAGNSIGTFGTLPDLTHLPHDYANYAKSMSSLWEKAGPGDSSLSKLSSLFTVPKTIGKGPKAGPKSK